MDKIRKFREKIYDIVDVGDNTSALGKVYDFTMAIVIIVSILPLVTKTVTPLIYKADIVTTAIFIIDYILRLLVADRILHKPSKVAFLKYPFTPMAIVDLLSILPTILSINGMLKLFKIFRLLRLVRIFKLFRYSKNLDMLSNVIRKQKDALLIVTGLALSYVTISALIIFNVEPQTFDNFFEAFYWAVVSMTTMGYGDIYPVTVEGRVITMISAVIGIAIIALPAGILTAGYMEELENRRTKE